MNKDFIVTLNYAFKYGSCDPKNKEQNIQAYKEFGKIAEEKMKQNGIGNLIPNGLTGVWWDEVKQFVDKGVIDWSWTQKIWN